MPDFQKPTRRRTPAEKQRIVELALRGDVALGTVARDQQISRQTLRRWIAAYRGEAAASRSAHRDRSRTQSTAFVPVTIAPSAQRTQKTFEQLTHAVRISFPSGVVVGIDGARDAEFVCALLAQLQP